MKKICRARSVYALLGAFASASLLAAGDFPLTSPFTSPVVCDVDGNGTYGEVTDGESGSVRITAAGDLDGKIKGLPPGFLADCSLHCVASGNFVAATACGAVDAHGKLRIDSEGFVTPGHGCLLPDLRITVTDPTPGGSAVSCFTGFGVASEQ